MPKKEKKKVWSSFWLGDDEDQDTYLPFDEDLIFEGKDNELDTGSLDDNTLKLASGRRAIANFVNILTGEDIPVFFYDGKTGETDGKVVYLSADISKKEDFDPAVGLSLHEGSHILLTDFEIIKTLWGRISELYKLGKEIGISKDRVREFTHLMVNYVEDRFIDDYVFTNAPGYRPYYIALYDKYFNNEEVTKGLKSNLLREPTLPAYEARIINLTNLNTDLKALPGLRKIAEELSLKNISRLKTTKDRVKTAVEITKIVFSSIKQFIEDKKQQGQGHDPDPQKNQNSEIYFDIRMDGSEDEEGSEGGMKVKVLMPGKGEPEEEENEETGSGGSGEEGEGEDSDSDAPPLPKNPLNEDDVIGGEEASVDTPDSQKKEEEKHDEDFGDTSEVSKRQLKKIKEAIESQKEFLDHHKNVKKKAVSDKQKQLLDIIEKSGIILVPVGEDLTPANSAACKIDCVVVKKLTKELIFSGMFPLNQRRWGALSSKENEPVPSVKEAVIKGIQLGTALGKKLQIRQEINKSKYIRRRTGKIYKRTLHEFFNGNESICYKMFSDKFDKVNLHISVDASGSMSDHGKWEKTMTMAAAIAKACSMINNVRVCISFRTTSEQKTLSSNTSLPYIVLAYDSEVDKFCKIKNLFPYLNAGGATPEGLCFEAIIDELICRKPGEIYYFLNMSDGEPCFSYFGPNNSMITYNMSTGADHTRKQYKKILQSGVKGMSYFIESPKSSYSWGGSRDNHVDCFKKMYGKDAQFIDVNNITSIARTMNNLFLDKD